jgi:type III polyketide synthase
MAAPTEFEEIGLSIVGLGDQYPPNAIKPPELDVLSKRFHPDSPA